MCRKYDAEEYEGDNDRDWLYTAAREEVAVLLPTVVVHQDQVPAAPVVAEELAHLTEAATATVPARDAQAAAGILPAAAVGGLLAAATAGQLPGGVPGDFRGKE